MIVINPTRKITNVTTEGCSAEKFRTHLALGRDAVTFEDFEGCIKIPVELFTEQVPSIFADTDGTRRAWVDRFIAFKLNSGENYLILGVKKNEYCWGAIDNSELFDIYEYFLTLEWFDVSQCYASDTLKEKTSLWVSENTPTETD